MEASPVGEGGKGGRLSTFELVFWHDKGLDVPQVVLGASFDDVSLGIALHLGVF